MIPSTTSPLTKFVRTTEGWIVLIFGALLLIIPIIQSNLPPSLAQSVTVGKWVAIVTVVSRTALKIVALAKGAGLAPIQPTVDIGGKPLQISDKQATDVLTQIATDVKALTAWQSQPGTPASQILAGLSPTTPEQTQQQEQPQSFTTGSAAAPTPGNPTS